MHSNTATHSMCVWCGHASLHTHTSLPLHTERGWCVVPSDATLTQHTSQQRLCWVHSMCVCVVMGMWVVWVACMVLPHTASLPLHTERGWYR